MQQVADVLDFGHDPFPQSELVLMQVEELDELLPVDEAFCLEVAVVEEQVDLLGSEGDVEAPERLLEHEVGDPA